MSVGQIIFFLILGVIVGFLLGEHIGNITKESEILDQCFAGKSNNEEVVFTSGNKKAVVEVKSIGVKDV